MRRGRANVYNYVGTPRTLSPATQRNSAAALHNAMSPHVCPRNRKMCTHSQAHAQKGNNHVIDGQAYRARVSPPPFSLFTLNALPHSARSHILWLRAPPHAAEVRESASKRWSKKTTDCETTWRCGRRTMCSSSTGSRVCPALSCCYDCYDYLRLRCTARTRSCGVQRRYTRSPATALTRDSPAERAARSYRNGFARAVRRPSAARSERTFPCLIKLYNQVKQRELATMCSVCAVCLRAHVSIHNI